jgi:hypothetical protein
MKKILLFGIAILPVLCRAQSNTTQLPNGVIVHQAHGVEGVVEPVKNEPVKIRTFQDWTIPECIDALPFLEIKLNEALPTDRERYLHEKELLVNRINELKSSR